MHEHLNELAQWQLLAQCRAARLYQGGAVRRASLAGRVIGRGLQALGHWLTRLGQHLQGDAITVPPGQPQPVER